MTIPSSLCKQCFCLLLWLEISSWDYLTCGDFLEKNICCKSNTTDISESIPDRCAESYGFINGPSNLMDFWPQCVAGPAS